jgi:hypothetical protein
MKEQASPEDPAGVRNAHAAPRRMNGAAHAWQMTAMIGAAMSVVAACGGGDNDSAAEQAVLIEQGKQVFRFDTFGDEVQWTDALRMHEVISAAVDPVTALSVGLKVDADALNSTRDTTSMASASRSSFRRPMAWMAFTV